MCYNVVAQSQSYKYTWYCTTSSLLAKITTLSFVYKNLWAECDLTACGSSKWSLLLLLIARICPGWKFGHDTCPKWTFLCIHGVSFHLPLLELCDDEAN